MRLKCSCAPQFDAAGLAARVKAAGDRALIQTGEQLRARASALAPRRSGNLASSGRVAPESGKVTVSFHTPYAAVQHERADFRHPNGGRAGYLRAAAEDPAIAQALANRVAEALGAEL